MISVKTATINEQENSPDIPDSWPYEFN